MLNCNIFNSGNTSKSVSGGGGTSLGNWDPSTNTPTLPNPPTAPTYQVGDYYISTGTGTFAGQNFTPNDKIVVIPNGAALAWNKETGGAVDSVTGNIVDNTDPTNPVVTQVQSDWDSASGLSEILNKPDLSIYVPYTGATTNLDLGDHELDASQANITTAAIVGDIEFIGGGTHHIGSEDGNLEISHPALLSPTFEGVVSSDIPMDSGTSIITNTSGGDTFSIKIYNTSLTSYGSFLTGTVGSNPNLNIAPPVGGTVTIDADLGSSTATTQSANDNSTKLATTAYVDGAVSNNNLTWNTVTSTTQTIAVNNAYIARSISSVDFTLPETAAIGQKFIILYLSPSAGQLLQNAGQTIIAGDNTTTSGTSGKIQDINNGEVLEITCTATNTEFMVRSSVGNFTVV